ncbi:beta-ketoacyl-[acyl-carrier-protein] synthase family protein [Mucilaginibacter sp. FT3.2]|uniref:beta-ketoacyl-[acyl-carrier-protein] synthase family protein n=1 Tax=Mucilaginibacter sp. FT3.2 TaxID=2723090 RepID=UPI0016097E3B|nr:beta-ketoacyl-[acyl-carrier-protein] synthase family protein [Mucilaginibacter sp. FT3.2]MBB6232653.1 3-oxoacyl-(acyl-carrier-protein) synthase [Mucilaginibacter sp. FT3.2]
MDRIVVTGMGVISAIGLSVAENHAALVTGKTGIIKGGGNFPSRYAGLLPFGEVLIGTEELKTRLGVTESGITRTTLLALHAFKEAIGDAQLTDEQLTAGDTALIGATTVGGMCLTDELYANTHGDTENIEYVKSFDYASVNLYLQKRYHITGVVNTMNTACSSSANAIMYGCRLIKNGLANRVIVGGADSLAKFTVNGFNALRILSDEACAPFDQNRKGLNLGEGAAFLVLEKEADVKGKKMYACLSGYGNANDAYHPSSLSPEGDGPYLAMKNALSNAKLNPADIDFINAHGTGTENNDEVESRAMLSLFGTLPNFASTKGFTGHTLGAASAIEAVYSILNIDKQELYPNLNFGQPIADTGLEPVITYKASAIKHVMSNSFGFGGNCTSLIFSKA